MANSIGIPIEDLQEDGNQHSQLYRGHNWTDQLSALASLLLCGAAKLSLLDQNHEWKTGMNLFSLLGWGELQFGSIHRQASRQLD
jgi:hypothetical protein